MNIIKHKNIFFLISLVVILAGLSMAVISGFNYGIDFTGGTLIQINLGNTIPVAEIREITDEYDSGASIIHAGSNKEQIIIKSTLDLDSKKRAELFNEFKEKYNLDTDALIQSIKIGPTIGNETQQKAWISIIIATIGMLIYITFRFEYRFGLSAIIALLHDVLVIIAVYAIFKLQVNSSFIAAILTIVGYSINDTIVVFDRIRENLRLMKKDKIEDIINKSISQTITRTINTSFTTLAAIISLYIFGVESIKEFALPLIVGVAVGSYSSIFIASPFWHIFSTKVFKNHRLGSRRA